MGRRIAVMIITGALLFVLISWLDNLDVSKYVLASLTNDEQRELASTLFAAVKTTGAFILGVVTGLSGRIFDHVINRLQSLKARTPNIGFTDVKLSIARSTPPDNAGEVVELDSCDECHYVVCNLVNYGTSRVIAPSIDGHQLAATYIEPRNDVSPDEGIRISLKVHVDQNKRDVSKRKVRVVVQNHNNEAFVGVYVLKIDTLNRQATLTLNKSFRKA